MVVDMPPKTTMGERLRLTRKALGMSQIEFAKRLSLTQNWVSMVETNKGTLSNGTQRMLCELFGVNPEWLRDGSGKQWADPPEESTFDMLKKARPDMPDNFAQHIAEALDKLDADDWMFLARFAQDMAEKADAVKKSAPDEAEADNVLHCESVAKSGRNTPFDVGERRGQEMHAELERISSEDPDDSEDGGI